jgi:hypothetical protein
MCVGTMKRKHTKLEFLSIRVKQLRIQWGCHGTPSKNTNPPLANKIYTNYIFKYKA